MPALEGVKATRVPVRWGSIEAVVGRFPVLFGVLAVSICRSGSTRCRCASL